MAELRQLRPAGGNPIPDLGHGFENIGLFLVRRQQRERLLRGQLDVDAQSVGQHAQPLGEQRIRPRNGLDLTVGETQTLEVYAIYGGNVAPKLLDNAKLTFTSSADTVATVDTTGLVTAVGAGSATISVVVTTKTALEAKAVATVVTA